MYDHRPKYEHLLTAEGVIKNICEKFGKAVEENDEKV